MRSKFPEPKKSYTTKNRLAMGNLLRPCTLIDQPTKDEDRHNWLRIDQNITTVNRPLKKGTPSDHNAKRLKSKDIILPVKEERGVPESIDRDVGTLATIEKHWIENSEIQHQLVLHKWSIWLPTHHQEKELLLTGEAKLSLETSKGAIPSWLKGNKDRG